MSEKPPSKMNKHELRAALMERGYQSEHLEGKGRPALMELLKSEQKGKEAQATLEAAAEVVDTLVTMPEAGSDGSPPADEGETVKVPPCPTDKAWPSYVLSLFHDEELEGQNPRVEGLRRVAELLVGTIVHEGCDLAAAPTLDNGQRACAKVWVVFDTDSGSRRYEALADAGQDNTDAEYARFPTSLAQTRGLGRCYRAALKLRRVVAAEEVSGVVPLAGEGGSEEAVHVGQVSVIQMLADRCKVSIPGLLKDLEIDKPDLRSLTKTEGMIVSRRLNEIQQTGHAPEKLKRKGEESNV